jgi:uncharacterized membrane protein YkoI
MSVKALLHVSGMVGAVVGALLAGNVALQPVLAQEAPPPADAASSAAPADAAGSADAAAAPADPAADPGLGDALSPEEEAELLKAKASIAPEEAHKAALATYAGGTVVSTIFGDENGVVVYEMQVFDATGMRHKVKVDANTGVVVHYPDD